MTAARKISEHWLATGELDYEYINSLPNSVQARCKMTHVAGFWGLVLQSIHLARSGSSEEYHICYMLPVYLMDLELGPNCDEDDWSKPWSVHMIEWFKELVNNYCEYFNIDQPTLSDEELAKLVELTVPA